MKLIFLLLSILSILSTGIGYKILGVFTAPSKSHYTLAKGIVDSLLAAGHEVTWATPFMDQKTVPNRTMIFIDTYPMIAGRDMTGPPNITWILETGRDISKVAAETKDLRETLINTQYDAVITEWFFSEVEAGLAAVQGVPWILLMGSTLLPQVEALVDDMRSTTMIPSFLFDYPVPMNFWQRTVNYISNLAMALLSGYQNNLLAERLYEDLYGPIAEARGVTLPPFSSAMYNISVLFVNSHPSIAPARSLPPNVIDIAGYHIDENIPPLPKDLQKLLDSSKNGVVYFSMGSVLKPADILGEVKKDLVKMFQEIPQTVLWKFDEIEGLPKNVHVRPWMPQSSILAHPNVKLFITHGGQLSSLEAIYHGVPLLSVPVFGDQPGNAERAVKLGIGLKVPYSNDMVPELKGKLTKMLQDNSYHKRAKYLSKLFRNRPVSPSKLISHYVELAIESKGALHLRSTTYLYKWYERWMLDVIALLILLSILLWIALKKLVKLVLKKITGKNKEWEKKKK